MLLKESKNTLRFSKEWYHRGYEKQINHWNAVQYLSLTAITEGNISHSSTIDIWTITKLLAERDAKEGNDPMTRIWAWGTLAELYLLSPLKFTGDDKIDDGEAKDKALFFLKRIQNAEFDFIDEAPEISGEIKFARESTFRQLERYISWWPEVSKLPGVEKLKILAAELSANVKL